MAINGGGGTNGRGGWFIGQLGRRVGLSPQAIRYYERLGLVGPPRRTAARYRVYSQEDAARLRFIRQAQRLGLSLGEIKELVDLRAAGRAPCGRLKAMVRRRLEDLDRRIRELEALRAELNRWMKDRERLTLAGSPGAVCGLVAGDAPPT